jgi:hypothetical protein
MSDRSYNGRNILTGKNADFENSPGGVSTTTPNRWIDGTSGGSLVNDIYKWRLDGSGSVRAGFETRDQSNAMKVSTLASGSYAEVRNDNNFYATTLQYRQKLIPGRTYQFTYSMETNYVSGDSAAGAFAVVMLAKSSGVFSRSIEIGARIKTTTEKTVYTGSFVAKADEDRCHIELLVYGHTGAGTLIMDAWFDNISITEIIPERPASIIRNSSLNRVGVRDMGTALKFSTVSDVVDIGTTIDEAIAASGKFTIDILLRKADRIYGMPICLGGGSVGKVGIAITANNALQGRITNGVSVETNFQTLNGSVPVDSPIRVSFTFDGNNAKLFLKGVLKTTQAITGFTMANGSNLIGRRPTSSDHFKGLISEVRIWDRDLSTEELLNIYVHQNPPRDRLLAEYLFNEGSGSTAIDTSGNGNNGTITGATYVVDSYKRNRTLV